MDMGVEKWGEEEGGEEGGDVDIGEEYHIKEFS